MADEKKYRTEVPNIIDDLGLDPYERALYTHYKRVCGANQGQCTEGIRTTAEKTKMSIGKATAGRKALIKRGLIAGDIQHGKDSAITTPDIWDINTAYYADKNRPNVDGWTIKQLRQWLSNCSPDEQLNEERSSLPEQLPDDCSPGEHNSSYNEQHCSPGEQKKEPIKNEPLQELSSKDDSGLPPLQPLVTPLETEEIPGTPIIEPEKEMVLPVTQKGVMDDTNYQGNGVTDNTQSYLINPSLPTNESSNEDDKSSLPGNKKSKPKGAREPTGKQLEAQAMFMALVTACHYDLSLISAKERGELNQAEAKMRQNGYRPVDVQGFCEWWYANDWRGKTDQAPTLNDIRSSWGKYKAFLNGEKGGSNPKNGVHRNGSKPTRTRQPGIITAAQGTARDEAESADSGSSGGSQGAKPRGAGILSGGG